MSTPLSGLDRKWPLIDMTLLLLDIIAPLRGRRRSRRPQIAGCLFLVLPARAIECFE